MDSLMDPLNSTSGTTSICFITPWIYHELSSICHILVLKMNLAYRRAPHDDAVFMFPITFSHRKKDSGT